MKTSLHFTSYRAALALACLTLTCGAFADDLVQPGNGGDERPLLDHTRVKSDATNGDASGAIIRDKKCAKKTLNGKSLKSTETDPAYEKCVKDKLESAKKTGDH